MNRTLRHLLRTGSYYYSAVLLAFCLYALTDGQYWLALALAISALLMLLLTLLVSKQRMQGISAYVQTSVDTLGRAFSGHVPYPMLTVRLSDGEILWHNKDFEKAINARQSVAGQKIGKLLPEFSLDWVSAGKAECETPQLLHARRYRVLGGIPETGEDERVALLHFIDSTELLNTRDSYLATRPIISIILVDNYDELTNNLSDSVISNLSADLNRRISAWADEVGGLLRKMERNRFLFLFEAKDLYRITDKKFSLLDAVREVVSPGGIAATVSIGIGKDGMDFTENYNFAALALEMALSRGGDQAVIKDKYDFSFFGGHSRETERRTKVKARVVASSLCELITQSSHVFIMGHKNADADALGAAAGLCAICRAKGKKTHIITNLKANAAGKVIQALCESPDYKERFISGQDALLLADAKSLLIVVDTNRPDQVESQPLLESMQRLALIDHHRRAADYISRAALSFHEPFASSSAELVTEILMYAVDPKDIYPCELNALLSGIVLDTKNFSVRVNSRTFEAAAFLRRLGADTVNVKKMFQSDFESTVARYRIIQEAHVYRSLIAVAAVDREITRALGGQAADELLNIAGIETSFVLFRQGEDVYISGRSIGDINVQIVLEPLGGGGNAATAGAQLHGQTMDAVKKSLVDAIDRYFGTEA